MSGRGGFSGTSRGGRGGAGGGRGGMGNTGGKRYSADVTKGPSAWKQEWSGFISGVKMTDQGKNVKLARHADFSGGAAGGYDFSADFDDDDYFTRRFGKPTTAEPVASKKEVDAVSSLQEVPTDAEKALPVDADEEIAPKKRITIESEYDEESDKDEEGEDAADSRRDDRSGGNIFSYLFSSPADRKAEREAKKKEEERKRRERMLKNQRAGLAEYAGDDRSLMERALEHAKVDGISLEGLNRKQKRELLKRTGFVHKDTDDEEKEEEEDEEKEIKPHDLMEPKIAWYQQGPFPIDEISEKLVIKKAAKKAKQLGMKYNSLTVHESWVASRAMKRKLALIANSAPSAVKKTFDDDGNIIYDTATATSQLQQNNFWSASETAPQMPSIIAMGGAGMIGFEGGLTAPSAAPLTRGQILLEKYQQQQLKKKQERMARQKAEEEEKARREEEEIMAKEAKEKRQKEKAKDNRKKAAPAETSTPSEENTKEKKKKNSLAHTSDFEIDSKTRHRQNKVDTDKDLPKGQDSKKKKHDDKPRSSTVASDHYTKDQDCDDIVIDRLDGGDDTGSEGGSDFDYNDFDDDGHTDDDDDDNDDDAKSSSDDSASSDDDADDGNEKSETADGKRKSKLSDEEKDKRRKLRREQREKRKLAKKNKNPKAKAKREPKPDSVRTLRQMIFEKYGGKRPPRDVREQLKKAKQEAQARRDARKAKNKAMMKKRVGSEKPNGSKAAAKNSKPAPKKTQPDAPSTPSEMTNRQLKKLRRVEEFIAKKKAVETTGSASA